VTRRQEPGPRSRSATSPTSIESASVPGVVGLEVALGFKRGHTAGARGRDGLAVGEVGDVARREDAGHGPDRQVIYAQVGI
jgi:hypothetical protein